eukprot:1157218-Pelagomonas_calceolata.AAC.5
MKAAELLTGTGCAQSGAHGPSPAHRLKVHCACWKQPRNKQGAAITAEFDCETHSVRLTITISRTGEGSMANSLLLVQPSCGTSSTSEDKFKACHVETCDGQRMCVCVRELIREGTHALQWVGNCKRSCTAQCACCGINASSGGHGGVGHLRELSLYLSAESARSKNKFEGFEDTEMLERFVVVPLSSAQDQFFCIIMLLRNILSRTTLAGQHKFSFSAAIKRSENAEGH